MTYRFPFRALLFGGVPFLVLAAGAFAGSATWSLNPTSGDWNTAANCEPATVPNGTSDIATFDTSNLTDVSISVTTTVDGNCFQSKRERIYNQCLPYFSAS